MMRVIFLMFAMLAKSVVSEDAPTKSFIFVIPDGYSVASQVLARDYYSLKDNVTQARRPSSAVHGVDSMVIGTVRTQSADNLITDSAAAATALACGVKTQNGVIGVKDGKPVASILEAAHLAGLKTGLVVTSRMSHATPAGYSAHVHSRKQEDIIAAQQIGFSHPFGPFVDVLMGGGRRHFLPKGSHGKREDGQNLTKWAEDQGYTYVKSRRDLETSVTDGKIPLPFLGLFTKSHMPYEIDRDPEETPSLLEMTKFAATTLDHATKTRSMGYFLMVEASRIDHAAHLNDAAAHLHDTLMYNEVMVWLRDFVSKHPDTQLLSAADHECGGLTLKDGYNPKVLADAKHSIEYIAKKFKRYGGVLGGLDYLKNTLLPMVGLKSASGREVHSVLTAGGAKADKVAIGKLLAKEAGLHWSTDGHTAGDVLLHGFANEKALGEMKRQLGKSNDNTELPKYIAKVLGLNMTEATKVLREGGVKMPMRRHKSVSLKRLSRILNDVFGRQRYVH